MKRLFVGLIAISLTTCGCTRKSDSTPASGDATDFECSSNPVAKGSRQFGMDILNQYSGGAYTSDFAALKALGGSYQTLHLTWSSLEATGSGTTSGTFSDPSNALQTFSSLATSDGIKLALTIRPVDATGKTVPSDLASTRFNSATMKTRFKAVIDYVLTRIPKANLVSIMIGNEIDNYTPTSDSNFWSDYGDFLNDLAAYVGTAYPGLQIGFTATFDGVTDSSKTLTHGYNSVSVMQTYANLVNVVGVTYYPQSSTFIVHEPTVAAEDFQKIDDFTSKPIHVQEIGYGTSGTISSSEAKQAEFYCEVFKAWDTHAAGIPNMALLRMNDVSRAAAETLAGPYGISMETFIEYLRTLGIQTNAGTKKQAYSVIERELEKRSF